MERENLFDNCSLLFVGQELASQALHERSDLNLAASVDGVHVFHSKHFKEHRVDCAWGKIKVTRTQNLLKLAHRDQALLVLVKSSKHVLEFEMINVHLAHVAEFEEFFVVNVSGVLFVELLHQCGHFSLGALHFRPRETPDEFVMAYKPVLSLVSFY